MPYAARAGSVTHAGVKVRCLRMGSALLHLRTQLGVPQDENTWLDYGALVGLPGYFSASSFYC